MTKGKKTHKLGWLNLVAVAVIMLSIGPGTWQAAEALTAAEVDIQESGAGPLSAPDSLAFSLPWTPPAPAYRIKVDADGLQALTYTALAAAGLPVDTLDPRSFRMYTMGQEIPIRVIGEADGAFGATDVLLFYGRNVESLYLDGLLPTNKYTGTNIYWLTYACATGPCAGPYGLRMADADGSGAGSTPPAFMHRERLYRSRTYLSMYPFEHDADHWFADQVTNTLPRTYYFTIANLSAEPLPGSLSIRLLGYKGDAALPVSHHLQVWLNGNLVIDGSPGWINKEIYETTVAVPASYFVNATNAVKIGLVGSDAAYPDWYDVVYPDSYVAEGNVLAFNNASAGDWRYEVSGFTTSDIEVYDVTDPFAPQHLIGTDVAPAGTTYKVSFGDQAVAAKSYLALTPAAWRTPGIEAATFLPSGYAITDLRSAGNAADYILITHRDFWAEAQTLVAYRDYDFRVALIDVQQIYDQFNGGLMSAEAIRDFLAYAHANWLPPAPAYVLLMGDGTNDMRKYRSTTNTYIPPYLYLADPDLGETAADNRFVTFIGNDNIPDMHIGRFPVNDAAQAHAMVDKTMRYEVICECNGVWERNTVFLADDLEDGGGDFYYYSDEIADGWFDEPLNTIKLIPETYARQKEYLGLTCDIVGNPTDAAECRANLVNSLNTTGALFVSFVGHSTKTIWAVESMFNAPASALLKNGPCLPVMLPMTCYEGSFHDYGTPETLAEASVRQAPDPVTGQTTGAVASFSPTGFGLVTGHDYLERGLMLAWFHEGIDRLGASVTYAKQYLVAIAPEGKYLDLLDTFLLLGDPALQIKATEDICLAPTGISVASFAARQEGRAVELSWQTVDESEIAGFNVLRRSMDETDLAAMDFASISPEMIPAGQAGVNAGESYTLIDEDTAAGLSYQYRLEIVRLDGGREPFGLAEITRAPMRYHIPWVGQSGDK